MLFTKRDFLWLTLYFLEFMLYSSFERIAHITSIVLKMYWRCPCDWTLVKSFIGWFLLFFFLVLQCSLIFLCSFLFFLSSGGTIAMFQNLFDNFSFFPLCCGCWICNSRHKWIKFWIFWVKHLCADLE